MNTKLKNGLITIAIGLLIWFIPVPGGLNPQAWQLLAIFVATIIGFILLPLPIGAVAFIALAVAATLKVLAPHQILAGLGDETIWLIVSAFLFAKGFIKTGLGRRIAYRIMGGIGDSSLKLGYAMVLSDLVISPAPIYFGAGYIPQGTWWRLGFIMSVVNLIIFIGIGGLWWKQIGLW